VTSVRLIHKLARQFHSLLIDISLKQLGEKPHAVMLVNRVRGRNAHGIAPFWSDTRDRVSSAFVARHELGPFDPIRQTRGVAFLKFGWSDVGQVTAPAWIVNPHGPHG